MDVLVYSALNEQAALKKEVAEKQACLFDLKQDASAGGGGASGSAESCAKAWLNREDGKGEKGHWLDPADTTKWHVWEGEGWTGGLKVCDDTGYYRCNRSCTWTVPSGVTKARFQLWGAGGGANRGPCCCAHTPFGSTGAYASVIIPVTAGWNYCMCTGCAYCCYAYSQSGAHRINGCQTWVNGCHFCNFCADGGQGSLGTWMSMRGNQCVCRVASAQNDQCGGQICYNGGDWCFTGNNFGQICNVPGSHTSGTLCDITCPTFENVVYGIRGIWSSMCFQSDHYGWEMHPPVYGFETATRCCPCYTSGNCCGYACSAWQNSCLRYPGAGGFASHAMGGGTGHCGDSGKFGMVCVSWK